MRCIRLSRTNFFARLALYASRPEQCWLWEGCTKKGYGWVRVNGRSQFAHRAAYEHLVGPVPDGMELDHLCRQRSCFNPCHLEPVTHLENVRRSPIHNGSKTHCKNGHEFTPANTYVRRAGGRLCATCTYQHQGYTFRRN